MREGYSFFLGWVVGTAGTLFLILSMKINMKRNFKEYLFSLKPDARKEVDEEFQKLYDAVGEMAVRTNTRLWKRFHNDLLELRGYLHRLWMQN